MSQLVERRELLKTVVQTALAVPLLASIDGRSIAQGPKLKASSLRTAPKKVGLNIRDFGATGDGTTKDTLAIQQTIDRCAVLGGGEVTVPSGNYLTGALVLHSNVELHLERDANLLGSGEMSDYPLTQVRWEGRWIKGYSAFISAEDNENISVSGPGKITGSPQIRGRVERATGLRLPALMEFTNCRNVRVENCSTSQAGMWSIHPVYCENVVFKNVAIDSGADGIDVDSCRHVLIDGCNFSTGDDCVSLKSGRGEEGYTINRPCEDVRIANCTFADSHFACIGIGSETSAGIRDVHIEHCKCVGARTHAIYIKSRPGRGAFIEDIYVNDFDARGTRQGFLRLNTLNSGKQDEFPVPGDEGIPTVRNFQFTNIHVTDVPVLVAGLEIHPHKPLVGFLLADVTGTCAKGIELANVKNAVIRNVKVTGFSGPLLSIADVTGIGLGGATKIDESTLPKPPEPIAAPATPYQLH